MTTIFYSLKPRRLAHSLSRGLFMRCRIWECNEDIFCTWRFYNFAHKCNLAYIKQVGSSSSVKVGLSLAFFFIFQRHLKFNTNGTGNM